MIKLIPGFSDVALRNMLSGDANELQAIVLEVYGSGGAPYHKEGLSALARDASEKGILIVARSQCLTGSVLPTLYAANVSDAISSGGDMTTEAVVTKLAYLFSKIQLKTKQETARRVRDMLLVDLRGEVSHESEYSKSILSREPRSSITSRNPLSISKL